MRNLIKQILREREESTKTDFQQVYSDLWDKMLLQVCHKYTKDRAKAEDYCQNGFMRVHKSLKNYTGKGSLEGWVRRVINNSILDELRKKKIDFVTPSHGGEDKDDTGTNYRNSDLAKAWEKSSEDREYKDELENKLDRVKVAMSQLTPAYKKIFQMYYFDKLNHREIAEKLGISQGTSKSNLSKAIANIKKLIK